MNNGSGSPDLTVQQRNESSFLPILFWRSFHKNSCRQRGQKLLAFVDSGRLTDKKQKATLEPLGISKLGGLSHPHNLSGNSLTNPNFRIHETNFWMWIIHTMNIIARTDFMDV